MPNALCLLKVGSTGTASTPASGGPFSAGVWNDSTLWDDSGTWDSPVTNGQKRIEINNMINQIQTILTLLNL